MLAAVLARRRKPQVSLSLLLVHRRLSVSLHENYSFTPPLSLHPNPTPQNPPNNKKTRYKPPSSLDRAPVQSDLPFDFRFSYTESSPSVRPIGLREPKYSPFGPGAVDRGWTGVCAPAEEVGKREDVGSRMEDRRRAMREKVLGEPLTNAERKAVVERCQRHRTKRQVNLEKQNWTIKRERREYHSGSATTGVVYMEPNEKSSRNLVFVCFAIFV